jgi:hypothetical protein
VGDKVLVEQVVKTKFSRDKYMGPFQVLEIPGNGTLKLALDGYEDTINLCRIKPYGLWSYTPVVPVDGCILVDVNRCFKQCHLRHSYFSVFLLY